MLPNVHDTTIQSFSSLEFIAVGKSGIVYGIDKDRVVKEYDNLQDSDTEYKAYQRLNSHPNIARCYRLRDGCIVIERGRSVREICKQNSVDQIPLKEKFYWIMQAATGIRHIHDQDIVHADIGCHNMIVIQDIIRENASLKIIDFEGCSIDETIATSCYEWFSYRRSTPAVNTKTDIFAFGCAMFEIMTGRPPYHEYEAVEDRTTIVEALYAQNLFPNVQDLLLGDIIADCWHARFQSMKEVIDRLRSVESALVVRERPSISRLLRANFWRKPVLPRRLLTIKKDRGTHKERGCLRGLLKGKSSRVGVGGGKENNEEVRSGTGRTSQFQ